jgi:cysteine protease ATG4
LAVKRVVQCGPIRHLQEPLLGHTWYTAANASGSVIWVLRVCYKITTDSGFEPISQSNFTSDLGWGCMLWSGQMLLAQVCVVSAS